MTYETLENDTVMQDALRALSADRESVIRSIVRRNRGQRKPVRVGIKTMADVTGCTYATALRGFRSAQ